jgi:hypothetical protein
MGHISRTGENNACRIFVGNPEGKWLLGRLRREENIKMNLRWISWKGGLNCIHLAENRGRDRLLRTLMRLLVGFINCWILLEGLVGASSVPLEIQLSVTEICLFESMHPGGRNCPFPRNRSHGFPTIPKIRNLCRSIDAIRSDVLYIYAHR